MQDENENAFANGQDFSKFSKISEFREFFSGEFKYSYNVSW